jgi:N-methylhydantoinase A
MYRVGFDVGGTFTDFTLHDCKSDIVHHHKVASTPSDPSQAIEQGLVELIERLGVPPSEISFIGHGTTVATNMVIERQGALTGLITTRGFRDVIEIGRQVRPELFDYSVVRSVPLVPRELRLEVSGRIDADGRELEKLDENDVLHAASRLVARGVQAIVICFLHSYRFDFDEKRAAKLVRDRFPDLYVSVSSEVLPEFREFERFSTAVINGYVGPKMGRYIDLLVERMTRLGIEVAPNTIHSNGGLMSVSTVRAHPVRACLSGPAAGVVGAAETALAAGIPDVITFDVGGTSTDVSLIEGGRPTFTSSRELAGYPVRTPMIDVHVIGAGGGSVAWIDEAGALKVGPRSVGADPGPIAYGRGGTLPTLTDANIVLRRLNPSAILGNRLKVDIAAARQGIDRVIAGPLGLSTEAAALGIIRIAASNMSRAIRAVSTKRGFDVEKFGLVAYGGAGPLHAVAVAKECGMKCVLVPPEPGTLCARGILMSDLSLDFVRSRVIEANDCFWPTVLEEIATMDSAGSEWLGVEGVPVDRRRTIATVEARYHGQNHEIQVPVAPGVALDDFLKDFTAAHKREFGHSIPDRGIEVVNCRLKAVGLIDRPGSHTDLGGGSVVKPTGSRAMFADNSWVDTPIYHRSSLAPRTRIVGPAIIEEMSSTTIIECNQSIIVDSAGNLIIEF